MKGGDVAQALQGEGCLSFVEAQRALPAAAFGGFALDQRRGHPGSEVDRPLAQGIGRMMRKQ